MPDKPLNIFYAEPDPDRWIRFDRYPRRFIRRVVRGKQRPGGVMTVALNLMRGLDKMNVPYRFNDYRYLKKHPEEIACIIGKPHLLFERQWNNPVILGAGIYSHPIDRPNLFTEFPNVKRFLVPGEWMREMCAPYYGDKVLAWPTGIDTDIWTTIPGEKTTDFLIYDKVRWERERLEQELIEPLKQTLSNKGLITEYIKYGNYTHDELRDKLSRAKAVLFLCEHETQGLAYQQILATNTPILAWDRGGYWQDPEYYPERVKYQPVSSVPYWDERCGERFTDMNDFEASLNTFLQNIDRFSPRNYVLENLTLEICAKKYLQIAEDVYKELNAR
ncbi:glycosyltransferase family 1 protein [Mucilaginibacter terrenus]|uniref:Glycosyltransferase family 1 protein n=1 Tax=Mucilaginibacter terrenus TaxID=2482727 RepID=A0A3E2NMP7_9SPHI|nr:glycosyltransferase [Mucilaginibacter terrenus]RFZ82241.1 glycosyltransferase family 1 protein [Mucilaginibacter terrenus]